MFQPAHAKVTPHSAWNNLLFGESLGFITGDAPNTCPNNPTRVKDTTANAMTQAHDTMTKGWVDSL